MRQRLLQEAWAGLGGLSLRHARGLEGCGPSPQSGSCAQQAWSPALQAQGSLDKWALVVWEAGCYARDAVRQGCRRPAAWVWEAGLPFQKGPPELSWFWSGFRAPAGCQEVAGLLPTALFPTVLLQ